MAYTQADADALRKAMATGAEEVRFANGESTKFRSLAEMRSLLTEIEDSLSGTSSSLSSMRVVMGYRSGSACRSIR